MEKKYRAIPKGYMTVDVPADVVKILTEQATDIERNMPALL